MECLEGRRLLAVGDLDVGFGANGVNTAEFSARTNSFDAGNATAVQSDGRFYVAGLAAGDGAITRYLPTGAIDTTFGRQGVSPLGFVAQDLKILPDGKLVIVGHSNSANSGTFIATKLNNDGSPDLTFGTKGMTQFGFSTQDQKAYSVAVQPDGRIIVGGYMTSIGFGGTNFAMIRLNATGSIDTTFGSGGAVVTDFAGSNDYLNSMALQPDGRLVVGGSAYVGGSYDAAFARYLPSGALDTTFGQGGKVTVAVGSYQESIYDFAFQPDGKIVAAGSMQQYPGNSDFLAIRMYGNGALDSSFGSGGKAVISLGTQDDVANSIIVKANGTYVLGGRSRVGSYDDFAAVGLTSSGSLDTAFGNAGKQIIAVGTGNDSVNAAFANPDASVVLVGQSADSLNNSDYAIVRLTTSGAIDTSFGVNGKVLTDIKLSTDQSEASAIQSDGKIIQVGTTSTGSKDLFAITRWNTNGTLDSTFETGGITTASFGAFGSAAKAVAIGVDGKFVIVGSYNSVVSGNNNFDFAVARFNADGTLDTSFNTTGMVVTPVGPSNDRATAVLIQPDGKVVVAGNSSNGSNDDFAIVRYNSDGTLDPSFGVAGKTVTPIGNYEENASGLLIQPDGKLLVTGYTNRGTLSSPNYDIGIVRYTTNGVLDTTFDTDGVATADMGGTYDSVNGARLQSDGKIVIVGTSSVNGTNDITLTRLTSVGILDVAFGTGGITRTDFGGTDAGYAVAIAADGKLIAAGSSGTDVAVARYLPNGNLDTSFSGDGKQAFDIAGGFDFANSVIVAVDGGIVVSGQARTSGSVSSAGNYDFFVAKLVGIEPNLAPTNIDLSNASISENANTNQVVGNFSTTDPDAGNTFSYTLVNGVGSTDNLLFNINGNELRATAPLDYESSPTRSVRIRTTDQGGLYSEKSFTIAVLDVVESSVTLDNGNLVIGGDANPQAMTLQLVGSNIVITSPTTQFVSGGSTSNSFTVSSNSVTGQVVINGGTASDHLTIDFSNGNPIPAGGLVFVGGEGSGDVDSLELVGYALPESSITVTHTGPESGSVTLAGLGTIEFSQIEPLTLSGTAADLVIVLPAGADSVTLGDDGTLQDANGNTTNTSALYDSSGPAYSFEFTEFTNPTKSLTILRGSVGDDLTVLSLVDSGFTASLILGSAAEPLDDVTFAGAISLGSDKSFSARATGTINLTTPNSNIAVSGVGAIDLVTSRNIVASVGSSLITQNGNLTLTANLAGTEVGDFAGVDVNGGLLNSGMGRLAIRGQGGLGTQNSTNYGVRIRQQGLVTSSGGDVSVEGTGGGSGTSFGNAGVYLEYTGSISAGGSGEVSVWGQGGTTSTGNNNSGIYISGANATISSDGGNVYVSGYGGGSGVSGGNDGIVIDAGGQINANGSGRVDVIGYGGAHVSGDNNRGILLFGSGSKITGNDGPVGVIGVGGGTVTSSSNYGLGLIGGSKITSGGIGDISVSGTGGSGSGLYNTGVSVGYNSEVSSGGGSLAVTGIKGEGAASFGIDVTNVFSSTGRITTAANGGELTLIADSMKFDASSVISAGPSSKVTLRPNTTGQAINLGGTDGPISLGLTDAELGRVSAGTIQIGDFNSGPITVSDDMTWRGNALELVSGSVTIGSAALNLNLGYTPAHGTVFNVIENDGSDLITGEFTNTTVNPVTLAKSVTGTKFDIAYGNDVVLSYDLNADEGNDLRVTPSDTPAYFNDRANFPFSVAGLDNDATAVVTFTDGNPAHETNALVSGNGTYNTNLTSLIDGTINVTITAIDNVDNAATGMGSAFQFLPQPRLHISSEYDTITENDSAGLTVEFLDFQLGSLYDLTIDWDDPNAEFLSVFSLDGDSLNDAEVGNQFFSTTDSVVVEVLLNSHERGVLFSVWHQYLDDGSSDVGNGTEQDISTVTVSVTHGPSTVSTEITIQNYSPDFFADVTNPQIVENDSTAVTGVFSDLGKHDRYELSVTWNDPFSPEHWVFSIDPISQLATSQTFYSTTPYAGTLTITNVDSISGHVEFTTSSHQYLDDDNDAVAAVDLLLSDDDDGFSSTSLFVGVFNSPPQLSLSIADPIDQNNAITLLGSYSDIGRIDQHNLVVLWGDPSVSTPTEFRMNAFSALAVGQTIASTGNTASLTITSVNSSTGVVGFSVAHQYPSNMQWPGGSVHQINAVLNDDDAGSSEQSIQFSTNHAPTNVTVSPSLIAENRPVGSLVGSFSTTDLDAGDSFTYSLAAGGADNGQFSIVNNTLVTAAVFDYETKSSYSIRVRTTDFGGAYFEKTLVIGVADVAEDTTRPTSSLNALAANTTSLVIPVSVTGSDSTGPEGPASGVKEYDLYYTTGGAFVKFATVPASSPTTTFTGSPNTTYWFRSLARDNAGNVEVKTTSDTYTRIGDIVPPTTQVTSAVPTPGGSFTVLMNGTKASGTALTHFDVYVAVDGGSVSQIGAVTAGTPNGGGVYSGSLVYQGLADGISHAYRFYSRGRDGSGNVEAAPTGGDVSVVHTFVNTGLTAIGIDVQNGANQRSYVRNLDVLFSSATGLGSLLGAGRVVVERFAIGATSVTPGTGTLVNGAAITQSGNKLKIDFGASGLGGVNVAGNGFYRVRIDSDGNGSYADAVDSAFEFFRLFGDANGDGMVDVADTNLVTGQVGQSGSGLDGDLDGNGTVNSLDRLFSTQQRNKKLNGFMMSWLDD